MDIKFFKELKELFVTRDEYEPTRKIVHGMVAAILLAFVGAVVALVIR